ncbi:MAG: hypothetical protein AB3N23_20020 [Paracoccaceae bacterium]
MKHFRLIMLVGMLSGVALSASAECYADYKAKQDAPLRLHYGIAQIQGPCSAGAAAQELAPRLARGGWTLLTVMSVFGPEGLSQRRGDAGPNYLRY